MRRISVSGRTGFSGRFPAVFIVAATVAALAGCTSTGDGAGGSVADKFFNMRTTDTAPKVTVTDFSDKACPKIEIRPGTEALILYDKSNQPAAENIRYQESITRTARECLTGPPQQTIKIGVAGHVAAGPKGVAGTLSAPIRIAVLSGDTVLYSELHKVDVALAPPILAADFQKVVEVPITVPPGDDTLKIVVGFDEKAPPKKKPLH